jgi:DNA repair exonuclease SbcCD ATPase subunit
LEQQIARLESLLADLQARLPAHSIPPNLIAEMDEIDEQISEARSRLAALTNNKDE